MALSAHYTYSTISNDPKYSWIIRHSQALDNPTGIEIPTVRIFQYLGDAIEAHKEQYGMNIADDYILGAAWLEIAKQVRVLLNGELGRLDGGTLDRAITSLAETAGFKESELDNLY